MLSQVRLATLFRVCLSSVLLLWLSAARPAFAVSGPEPVLDASLLLELEHKAAVAEPKDRCYLYTELLHGWTELASQRMASGDDSEAALDLTHADADVDRLKAAMASDSKRLKNAELLLERTAHHLADMVRVASLDQHDAMQMVLRHLNSAHDALLAQIFAH